MKKTTFTLLSLFLSLLAASGCSSKIYEKKQPLLIVHEDGYVETLPPLDCPDWSNAHMANYGNTVLSNFGCAHATNLAVMVEDPADLTPVLRRRSSPDVDRAVGVVAGYKASALPESDSEAAGAPTGGAQP